MATAPRSRADIPEQAARILAQRVASLAQCDRHFSLQWQNHSSLSEEQSAVLQRSFREEISKANPTLLEDSGARVLRITLEDTPATMILVASVPCSRGQEICVSEFPRAAPMSVDPSDAPHRLSKELLWKQRESILDAVESEENLLLVLTRENVSAYRRHKDGWELEDGQPIPAGEVASRDPRGEIRLSSGPEKANRVVLAGKSCDLGIAEKITLTCRSAEQAWRDGLFLAVSCQGGVLWMGGDTGDWTAPDRLLLRNPSLPPSAPALAELELPGPLLSISSAPSLGTDTAVVFNLATGNYEVYRISLACGS